MRRAARVDTNHASVTATLRSVGWTVRDTSALGNGFPDLVAARAGILRLVEVKDGSKPPSARKLTDKEFVFWYDMRLAGVDVLVIESVQQAVEMR